MSVSIIKRYQRHRTASRAVRISAKIIMVPITIWGFGALYYSTLQPQWVLLLIAGIFIITTISAIFAMPFPAGSIVWAIAIIILMVWYVNDAPSDTRDWAPEYAIPATVTEDGPLITIHHIRDFSYRSESEVTPHYYDATFRLDALDTVDLVTSYWSGDAIAHIFLTFGFLDGRHLAISIETRRQQRFQYSTIAGFFHHFELIYVVADERDLIGVRTDIRRERVYLYRLQIAPGPRQALFLSYMHELDRLAQHPAWYNTLTDNCTTGALTRAKVSPIVKYNWRSIVSGHAAEYAYDRGLLNTSMPFAVLKEKSLIVRPEGSVIDSNYSEEIRQNLPLSASPLPSSGTN